MRSNRTGKTRTGNTRHGGWSTVELAASVTLLVFGVLGLAAGFHGSARLAEKSRENYLFKHAYTTKIGELEAHRFDRLSADFAQGSGKESFYCGDDNTDGRSEQKLFYASPQRCLLRGSIQLKTDETQLPVSWTGLGGGLDLDADGLLSTVLDGSGGPYYCILPVQMNLVVDSADGPRTLQAGVILWR